MSLTKLLKVPIKLFKKDVITFLTIRRHDLGILEENLRYIAVKPTASVSVLRHKVWHLLNLPDYCEEVIILKSDGEVEIPLTELRKGNTPQRPYILEVWLPGKYTQSVTKHNNMLTMGEGDEENLTDSNPTSTNSTCEEKINHDIAGKSQASVSNDNMALNKLRILENKRTMSGFMQSSYKKSEVSCRMSTSSIFFKHNGRKSGDNFTNILLKIQSDLSTLSNKLSNLEKKIPS